MSKLWKEIMIKNLNELVDSTDWIAPWSDKYFERIVINRKRYVVKYVFI